jgi:hypothetical protein
MNSVAPRAAAAARSAGERRRRQQAAAPAAAEALHRRPRPVGRQLQLRRRAGERLPPVGELRGEHLARQPGALPAGEVGVLERQLGQRAARRLQPRPPPRGAAA